MSKLPEVRSNVPAVFKNSIVIDLLYNMLDTPENVRLARAAGLTAMQHSVLGMYSDRESAWREIAEFRNFCDSQSNTVTIVTKAQQIRDAKASGKLAMVMGIQNPLPMRDDMHILRTLYDLGLRCLMLTHNTQNYIGTGCGEPDNGLTGFGRKVVAECNRLGIVIDVAHSGPKTSIEAAELSDYPIMSTHANPRGIAKIARKGGVVGIAAWSPLCERGRGEQPTLEDVLDCFDYALKVVGPDHVALGSDTNENKFLANPELWNKIYSAQGIQRDVVKDLPWYRLETQYAKGMDSVTHLPDLTEGLLKRGHSEAVVKKIIGENALRVFEKVLGG
jgi:membrane dipeptidase